MEFQKIKFRKMKFWKFGILIMEFRKIEFKNWNFGKLFLRMEFHKIILRIEMKIRLFENHNKLIN